MKQKNTKNKRAKISFKIEYPRTIDSLKAKVKEIEKENNGMKSALKDILKIKKEVTGYNVSGQLRKYLQEFSEYYFREQTKNKIMHKFIYTSGTPAPKSGFYEIKYLPKELPKEYLGSTITLCYDNIILNLIWEPELIAIKTKSKELSEDYKKHFELIWKIAKK